MYLIRDLSSDRLYALKKILITSGQEGVKEAMREVEAYRRFRHPNIIRILDSAVVQDESGDGKIIYLLVERSPLPNIKSADNEIDFSHITPKATCKMQWRMHLSQATVCLRENFWSFFTALA